MLRISLLLLATATLYGQRLAPGTPEFIAAVREIANSYSAYENIRNAENVYTVALRMARGTAFEEPLASALAGHFLATGQ